jgi:phage baseplate assembly protein V
MNGDFSGLLIGVVTDREDPAGEGRVRVRYTTFGDQLESDWLAIASPMSGKERGFRFCPEIGDECVVGFDRGDPNHPFILGFTHNGVDKPPSVDPRERVIQTPNGHTIRFRDPDVANGDKGGIVIEDGHGTRFELSNAHVTVSAVGALNIAANVLTLNGRPVVPGTGAI